MTLTTAQTRYFQQIKGSSTSKQAVPLTEGDTQYLIYRAAEGETESERRREMFRRARLAVQRFSPTDDD